MANWLNLAGGAAQGYTQSVDDERRRQEFNSMQKQRERVEKQQAIDDKITADLAKVTPAGSYDQYDTQPEEGQTGPPSAKKVIGTKTVTPEEAYRNRAAVYMRSGRPSDIAAGTQQELAAYQSAAASRAERQANLSEAILAGRRMNTPGNEDATFKHMQTKYELHPDGNRLVEQVVGGVPMMNMQGPDGKLKREWTPRTKENMDAMLNEAMGLVSQESYWKGQEHGLKKEEIGVHRTSAEAAKLSAESNAAKVAYDTTGPGGQAHLKYLENQGVYLDRHGRALLMEAQSRVAANKKLTPAEKAKELTDFYVPIIQDANPGMPAEQVRMKAAQVALKDPNAKDPRMTAIAGTEMMTDGKKIYRTDKDGELEEVMLPEDMKTFATELGNKLADKKKNQTAIASAVTAGPPTADAAATQQISEAEKVLGTYGLRQRRDDPTGYAAAVKRRDDARAQLDALNARYANTQQTGAAFTSARP